MTTIDASSPVQQARTTLIETIAKQRAGQATLDDVYSAADTYIAEIKKYGKASGRRMPIPTRAYLIRTMTY